MSWASHPPSASHAEAIVDVLAVAQRIGSIGGIHDLALRTHADHEPLAERRLVAVRPDDLLLPRDGPGGGRAADLRPHLVGAHAGADRVEVRLVPHLLGAHEAVG